MFSVLLGLWSGLIIGYVTEYYTSHSYNPVREIARTQRVSAATGIIYGLALGYLSTIVPIACLALTVCVAHTLCGMYGISLAAIGMLSTLTVGLMIDAYGPISDNAGGIAEMAGLGPEVRSRTDALDAAGNTTAAVGKVSISTLLSSPVRAVSAVLPCLVGRAGHAVSGVALCVLMVRAMQLAQQRSSR